VRDVTSASGSRVGLNIGLISELAQGRRKATASGNPT